jgi:hypothetical protein
MSSRSGHLFRRGVRLGQAVAVASIPLYPLCLSAQTSSPPKASNSSASRGGAATLQLEGPSIEEVLAAYFAERRVLSNEHRRDLRRLRTEIEELEYRFREKLREAKAREAARRAQPAR